eukprot:1812546-Prymnesium_polylepis.1
MGDVMGGVVGGVLGTSRGGALVGRAEEEGEGEEGEVLREEVMEEGEEDVMEEGEEQGDDEGDRTAGDGGVNVTRARVGRTLTRSSPSKSSSPRACRRVAVTCTPPPRFEPPAAHHGSNHQPRTTARTTGRAPRLHADFHNATVFESPSPLARGFWPCHGLRTVLLARMRQLIRSRSTAADPPPLGPPSCAQTAATAAALTMSPRVRAPCTASRIGAPSSRSASPSPSSSPASCPPASPPPHGPRPHARGTRRCWRRTRAVLTTRRAPHARPRRTCRSASRLSRTSPPPRGAWRRARPPLPLSRRARPPLPLSTRSS